MVLATLLPKNWFHYHAPDADGLLDVAGPWWHTVVLLLLSAVAMVVVIKGADLLVEGAAAIAKRLGMPEVVIGATIVSLGTTSPEMAVSVLAAYAGNAGLALGNGVGSIIADTGLILGVGMLLTRLPADRFVLSRQGWVQLGAPALLAAICYAKYAALGDEATITRPTGLLLVALLVVYLMVSIRWARQHPHGEPHGTGDPHLDPKATARRSLFGSVIIGLVGLAMVVLAGDALVQAVSIVAARWGVPDVVIASTLVALGTSLPELVVGITAIRKGHPELLVGNVIGADILNILFVIGFAALARPLPIIDPSATYPAIFLQLQIPTMLAMLVLARLYIFRATARGHFSRWMGAPLVLMYVAFIIAAALLS